MGLSDREYYRDDQPTGFQLGGERMMVINLVIANAVVYVICMFVNGLTERLSLDADLFRSPRNLLHAWQLLTYGFVHAPINKDVFHILFNMFALWMFGRHVEQKYGRLEFLRFYLLAIVFSGVVWALRQLAFGGASHVYGASGAVTAVLILFCVNWPRQQVHMFGVMAMPAWVLGLLIVGMDLVVRGLGPDSHVAWDCHLAGAFFAFVYFKLGWNFGRFLPSAGSGRKWFKRKPALRVHQPDDTYDDLDSEADRVLAKVHHQGQESLTARERKVLEAYSRRMRQKLR